MNSKTRQTVRRARSFRCRTSDVSDATATSFFSALQGYPSRLDWSEVVNRKIDPTLYRNIDEFIIDYWAVESFSKFPAVVAGIDRKAEAIRRFQVAEELTRISNERTVEYLSRPRPDLLRRSVIKARAKLHSLLSGITRDEILVSSRWGPGATSELSRRASSTSHKWQFASHITCGALPWFLALSKYGNVPSPRVTIVNGNKVTTVPKNAKTDRVIAMEPTWNGFFQLGLGACLRRRARRVGLLYPDSQLKNAEMARRGSVTGELATIDLASASDSISLALCELLLPPDLYSYVIELRSPYGQVDGKTIYYEKVSSMGNGFTFELETLIFWSLAQAVIDVLGLERSDVTVYGDDIIVPVRAYALLTELLTDLGFSVNQKKSFHSGLFRESCGGHFFSGVDVTPPYFRRRLDSIPWIIRGANSLRRRWYSHDYLHVRLLPVWKELRSKVPRFLWGLPSESDGHVHCSFDESTPTWDRRSSTWTGKTL